MQPNIRLGFLTHTEGTGTAYQIYQETLALFAAADALGFDVGWLAEHHFKPVAGRLPSLFPFLAAAAQRTCRIRLGVATVLLPYSNPFRVAEDAAVVDTLSGGRLELGVGSGLDPLEYDVFGVDFALRHTITTAAVNQLLRALRGEPLGAHGQVLEPPAPLLAGRLWQAAMSESGAQYVARQGAGLILARTASEHGRRTDENQLPVAQAYLAAWQESAPPRIAVSRTVVTAKDKRTALASMEVGVARFLPQMIERGVLPAGLSLDEYCRQLHFAYGHPDEVIEFLAGDRVLPYATDLILQVNPATPPLEEALRILEEITVQIAPAFGWRPALSSIQESI